SVPSVRNEPVAHAKGPSLATEPEPNRAVGVRRRDGGPERDRLDRIRSLRVGFPRGREGVPRELADHGSGSGLPVQYRSGGERPSTELKALHRRRGHGRVESVRGELRGVEVGRLTEGSESDASRGRGGEHEPVAAEAVPVDETGEARVL